MSGTHRMQFQRMPNITISTDRKNSTSDAKHRHRVAHSISKPIATATASGPKRMQIRRHARAHERQQHRTGCAETDEQRTANSSRSGRAMGHGDSLRSNNLGVFTSSRCARGPSVSNSSSCRSFQDPARQCRLVSSYSAARAVASADVLRPRRAATKGARPKQVGQSAGLGKDSDTSSAFCSPLNNRRGHL